MLNLKAVVVFIGTGLAAFCGLFATAIAGEMPLVELKNTLVTVEGDLVRLGDLFSGVEEQADVAVARAPSPGKVVEVDAYWLAAVAQQHALPWRPRSRLDRVVIERASREIGPEAIAEALRRALTEAGVEADVDLQLDNPSLRLVLPVTAAGDFQVEVLSYDAANGRLQARLRAPTEGPVLAQASVTGRAVPMVKVPVLAEATAAGSIIGNSDLVWRRMPEARLGQQVVLDASQLVGMTPRRGLRAERPIRVSDLRAPVVISKNSPVTIVLQTDKMRLSAQGRALEDGAKGALIRVMNTQSNQTIHAQVQGPGQVNVVLASRQPAGS